MRRIVVDALQVSAEPSGVGRQVQAIGAALATRRADVELRCTREAAPLLAPAFAPGTRVVTPLRRSTPRWRRIAYQQLVAPLRERRDTLLVSLGDQGPLFGRARRLLVINDVRRLVERGVSGERLWYRSIVPRAARRAHRIATISEFSAAEIRRVLGLDASVIAHHPPPAALDAGPAPVDGPVLVVGALRPYKGIETAVAAVRRLDGARLVLAGAGRRPAGAGPETDALGWVPDARLEELYRAAAVVVAPSEYEGYGLTVAESIARAKPTVASDIPPHREIGGDAILYFPPGDDAALAARIAEARVRSGELAAAALARSRALATQRPDWAEVILAAAQ